MNYPTSNPVTQVIRYLIDKLTYYGKSKTSKPIDKSWANRKRIAYTCNPNKSNSLSYNDFISNVRKNVNDLQGIK